MCGWRRSLAAFHQVQLVTHEASQRQKLRWLFLTLTVRNCEGEELKSTIDHMMKSWNRLTKYKAFDSSVVGWFRSLEVTRNNDKKSEWNGTYHPHFHVLIAVSPSYFTRNYIKQNDWIKMWQKALKADYEPSVDIRAVKSKRDRKKEAELIDDLLEPENELIDGLLESTKYATKSKDFLIEGDESATDEAVRILDHALANRRLFAYGGLLKDIWNELRASDRLQDVEDENADLIHIEGTPTTCKCTACESDMVETFYRFATEQKQYLKAL